MAFVGRHNHGNTVNSMLAATDNFILLQTAVSRVSNPVDESLTKDARFHFDTGSQRTYVMVELARLLKLRIVRKEAILIKKVCDR